MSLLLGELVNLNIYLNIWIMLILPLNIGFCISNINMGGKTSTQWNVIKIKVISELKQITFNLILHFHSFVSLNWQVLEV